MLTKHEKTLDYAFMFSCVKDLATKIIAYSYNPTVLVADSAPAITNGFKRVFVLLKRIDCWSHVDRNIKNKINTHVILLLSFFFIQFN